MKKKFKAYLFLGLIFTGIALNSCKNPFEQRMEFCDCMNLEKAFTDTLLLSQNERDAKRRKCAWIEKEMSEMDILQKTAQCWSDKSGESQKDSVKMNNSPQTTGDTIQKVNNAQSVDNNNDNSLNGNKIPQIGELYKEGIVTEVNNVGNEVEIVITTPNDLGEMSYYDAQKAVENCSLGGGHWFLENLERMCYLLSHINIKDGVYWIEDSKVIDIASCTISNEDNNVLHKVRPIKIFFVKR